MRGIFKISERMINMYVDPIKTMQIREKRVARINEIDEVKEACWRIKGAILYEQRKVAIDFLREYSKKLPKWKFHQSERNVLIEVSQKFCKGEISNEEVEKIESLQEMLRIESTF